MRKQLVGISILLGAAFIGYLFSGPIADPRSSAQSTLAIDESHLTPTTPAKQNEPVQLKGLLTQNPDADASSNEALISLSGVTKALSTEALMELHAEDATEFQLTIPLGDEQVAAELVARDPFAEGARVTLDDSELNQDLVRSTKHFVSEDVSSGTHVSLALTDRGTLTGLFGVSGLNYLVSFDQDGLNTRLAERSFVAQASLMGGVSDVQPRSPRGAVVSPTAQSKSAGGAMGSSDKPFSCSYSSDRAEH